MFDINYLYIFILLIVSGFLYRRFMDKFNEHDELRQYKLIKKYLLNDSALAKSTKPIIWVHIPYELNARSWDSFYSRTNTNLNQPYQYLCIKSVVEKCGKSFNICLIDDNSFNVLIPGWTTELSHVGSPLKEKIRYLAMVNLIYHYGGIMVPSSFLCLKNLNSLWNTGTQNDSPFICENKSNNKNIQFLPDPLFIGSPKNNEIIDKYRKFLERNVSKDYTAESIFLDDNNKWCYQSVCKNEMKLISGEMVGTKTESGKLVRIQDLLGRDYVDFNEKMYGIYIPSKELINRTAYNWFCYLKECELLSSDMIISKYMVLSNAN